VSEAVASDPDTATYVEELEQRADELAEEQDLPSGEALAAELTRYLRERDRGNGEPDFASEQ
jgi:predicted transcriptional regulator